MERKIPAVYQINQHFGSNCCSWIYHMGLYKTKSTTAQEINIATSNVVPFSPFF